MTPLLCSLLPTHACAITKQIMAATHLTAFLPLCPTLTITMSTPLTPLLPLTNPATQSLLEHSFLHPERSCPSLPHPPAPAQLQQPAGAGGLTEAQLKAIVSQVCDFCHSLLSGRSRDVAKLCSSLDL